MKKCLFSEAFYKAGRMFIPFAGKARMAGPVTRPHAPVHIYDYVDHKMPQLAKMFEKRLKGYRAMGYEIHD